MSSEYGVVETTVRFDHEVVDPNPPCTKLGFCLTADLTGNGVDDVVVGGAGGGFPGKSYVWAADQRGLPASRLFGAVSDRLGWNVFWYENTNPGFVRHDVAFAPHLDVGAALGDITGDGRPNLVVGQGLGHTDIYWYEMPADPRKRWKRHLLTDAFEKYHDLAVADVDDDGELEVVGLSQESETLFYYDVPDDPYQSPWPEDCLTVVDTGRLMEGLVVVDVDGDGRTEILAGTNIYHRDEATGEWTREDVATGWDQTRVAVGDLNGDGELEIVYSEGDSPTYGTHPGRVAWFGGPDWEPHFLAEDLFCPHSLAVADFDGDGHPDVYVAEMGLGENEDPRHLLFRNRGDGTFEEHLVAHGVETHEATVADLNGDGRLDVVGKSYTPDHHVDVWFNEG
jgi:hypothetical protein